MFAYRSTFVALMVYLSSVGATAALAREDDNPLARPGQNSPAGSNGDNPLARPSAPKSNDADNPLAPRQPTPGVDSDNPLAGKHDRPAANENSPRRNSPGSMKFIRLGVNDPGINNIEALSMLIPSGWKAEGRIQWVPDLLVLANLLMRVTDPQTGAEIEFLPAQNFVWMPNPVMPIPVGSNYMGSIVCQPINDPDRLIQSIYGPQVLKHLIGQRPIGTKEFPAVVQSIVQSAGGSMQASATRTRYQFTRNGQPWEEDVTIISTCLPNPQVTIWSVNSIYSFRAPQGMLDQVAPTMQTTISSFKLSLDWYAGYAYVQKLFMDRQRQGIADAAAISRTVTQNSEDIRRMFSDSYQKQNESQDRISQQFSETIRGVETYTNPYEARPIQLPSGYNDGWVNAKGEYLLSNEAGFDPNIGATAEWRRMEKRNP